MTSHFENVLDHYLAAALQKAKIFKQKSQWQGQLSYAGGELVAHAASAPEVRSGLKVLVERRVFDSMRKNQTLPVIDGIEITPGSC